MGCNCGKPKCDGHCGVSPAVLQINNPSECVLFRKVEVPASMGTSVENPPKIGAYRNVLLYYNADGEAYLYSSDGIPTKVTGTTSNYEILTNKPKINGVELVGDKSLADIGVTNAINNALEPYTPRSELAEVAFSGSYNDLTNKPTIPAAQVNSDWNAASGVAQILNKPSLATVATSGSYNDLTNKPTIPTVNNATLTVTQNGTSAGTFTANASSDTTINLTDTTYSDFSGATSSVAGASGLVPAPTAGDEDKALKGDGTWSVVGDVVELFVSRQPNSLSTPFEIYKSDGSTPITHSEMRELFTPSNKKTVVLHDTTSYDGVYPVIGFCYDTTEFYIFDAVYSSTYYIASAPGGGDTDFAITRTDLQRKLTAGSNITISGDTISASMELVEMSYGESNAWAKFIAAYQSHKIVYCRASSSSNPATGSQTRKAFMAFVNAADNPTEVEFQYVRSVGTKTSSQPVDQIFVYKLTSANGGTWTVETRDVAPKLAAGTNATVSYSSGTYTIGATVPTKTSDLTNDGATGTSAYIEESDIAPSELSGEGEFIALEGTTDCSILDTQLLGNAEQSGTPTPGSPVAVQTVTGGQNIKVTGKNLLDTSDPHDKSGSGMTATWNNGTVEVKGTNTTTSFPLSDNIALPTQIKAGTEISASFVGASVGNTVFRFFNQATSQYEALAVVNPNTSGTYTLTRDADAVQLYKGSVQTNTYKEFSISNWQIEYGSTATTYIPYQGQRSYEVNLGKNLFHFPLNISASLYSVAITASANASTFILNGTSTATSAEVSQAMIGTSNPLKLKAGTYTCKITGLKQYTVQAERVYLAPTSAVGTPFVILRPDNGWTSTFTLTEDTDAVMYLILSDQSSHSNTEIKVQIETGTQATSYSEYFTPLELAKIGTYQDRIYKDDGKWYIEKNVGKVVLIGANSENWQYTNGVCYTDSIADYSRSNNKPLSDNFTTTVNVASAGSIADNTSAFGAANLGTQNRFYVKYTSLFTSAATIKTWLGTHPTTVYYALDTPTTTEITDETLIRQLEGLADALGYDGVTNIISTSPGLPAILSVSTYTGSAIPPATRARAGIVRIGDGIDVDDCGTISVNAQKAPTVITIDLGNQNDWSVVYNSLGPMLALGAGSVSSSQYDNRVRVVSLTPPTSTTFHNENTDIDMTLEEVFGLIESGEDVVFNNVPVGTYYDSRSEVYYPLGYAVNGVRVSDKLNYSDGTAFTGHVAINVPSPQSLDTQWDYNYPIVASISIRKLVVINGDISTTSYYLDVDGIYDGIVAD